MRHSRHCRRVSHRTSSPKSLPRRWKIWRKKHHFHFFPIENGFLKMEFFFLQIFKNKKVSRFFFWEPFFLFAFFHIFFSIPTNFFLIIDFCDRFHRPGNYGFVISTSTHFRFFLQIQHSFSSGFFASTFKQHLH